MTRLKLAVLISGRGSNMETLLKAAAAEPDFPAEPVLVVSNKPDAHGLKIAEAMGVAAFAIDHRTFGKDREAFEFHVDATLRGAGVEVIALAGFMRVLSPWFVKRWEGRMINIHPSLLPKYKGLDTHQRAIDEGDTKAGCTVHWVSAGIDEGEIIAQVSVRILPGDTADTLAARTLPAEHKLYPQALKIACKTITEKLSHG